MITKCMLCAALDCNITKHQPISLCTPHRHPQPSLTIPRPTPPHPRANSLHHSNPTPKCAAAASSRKRRPKSTALPAVLASPRARCSKSSRATAGSATKLRLARPLTQNTAPSLTRMYAGGRNRFRWVLRVGSFFFFFLFCFLLGSLEMTFARWVFPPLGLLSICIPYHNPPSHLLTFSFLNHLFPSSTSSAPTPPFIGNMLD